MKRLEILLAVFLILLVPNVLGVTVVGSTSVNCSIDFKDATLSNKSIVGLVSMDGHFTGNLEMGSPYGLFCPSTWSLGYGEPSFKYAGYLPPVYNGSGHVSNTTSTLTTFQGEIKLGFGANACSMKSSCDTNEACIFKSADVDNGHVADCSADNYPMENTFANKLCCQLIEVCDDNADNDGDGLIDCADSDCQEVQVLSKPPVECTANNQTTEFCLANPGICNNQYCSYGVYDNSTLQPQGFCCGKGTYSVYDPLYGWSCQASEICGIDAARPCTYDFSSSLMSWLSSYYQGDENSWCVSEIPDLYSPDFTPDQSAACCLIPKFGEDNYYVEQGNVRIFGVSAVCGDGDIGGVEQCDGTNLNGFTCADVIYCAMSYTPTGTPGCSDSCTLDVGSCYCRPDFTGGGDYQN
ncbi:hypothetical protein COV13_03975 [Candidatus Woesearchaeota archaeon CG10_big_fil_rev_8_21_14_0_10_32_9]|nr:MAG: hypothetical protein COV13_03975 [Candidatus Woesearchaeota archaeon CG10_big_fil_rev_8_21_14_0_10_32_9]